MMRTPKYTVWRRHTSVIVFFSTTGACIAAAWTAIGLGDYFNLPLKWLKELGGLGLYFIAIHSAIVGAIATGVQRVIQRPRDIGSSSVLAVDLARSLRHGLSERRYYEVIRIGLSLSRPLFESGSFEARVEIGEAVEEAAATIDDKRAQIVALIDLIGWSSIELGHLERGEEAIIHGLRLAEELADYPYVSKATRHLGVIKRRQKDYVAAHDFYKRAFEAADEIADPKARADAIAGLDYANAALSMHSGDQESAAATIDAAIEGFTSANDSYKLVMALTLKANILLAIGRNREAKDIFRSALRKAEETSQRLQALRCHIGLITVYNAEGNLDSAREHLTTANELVKDVASQAEVAELASVTATIRPLPHMKQGGA